MSSQALKKLRSAGDRLRRGRSVTVRAAEGPLDRETADAALDLLGPEGDTARELDEEAEREMSRLVSLSALTTDLAEQYLERLARPIPSLTPAAGVQIVSRGYAARMALDRDPARFGAAVSPPGLKALPPLRNGRPPQDLLTRAVKATRRTFPSHRVVSAAAWDGFVVLTTSRVHQMPGRASGTDDAAGPVAVEVVDGLARFGWVLRMVDVRYGLEPDGG